MKKLDTLYFPDTAVFSETQYPLFLLINQLHYLRPVEPSEEFLSNDIFLERGLCQVHTPLPLGDDRDRFVHLLKDLQERKDDYAAQLSALTIANLSQKENSDDESRTAILSTLLGSDTISKEETNEEEEARIWQARLLLALGEMFDREEEELAGHLSFIDEKELAMFQKLQGESGDEEDDPFQDLLDLQQKISTPNPAMVKKRCQSWLQLYGNENFTNLPIWISTKHEAADYLFDLYEKQTGNSPYLCDKLEFPASIGRDMPYVVDALAEFKEKNAEILKDISNNLINLLEHSDQAELPDRPVISPSLENQWNEAVEESYPENLHGRKSMRVYYFQGCTLPGVLNGSGEQGNGVLLVIDQ